VVVSDLCILPWLMDSESQGIDAVRKTEDFLIRLLTEDQDFMSSLFHDQSLMCYPCKTSMRFEMIQMRPSYN
jgi:hypothetical protein